MPDNPTTLGTLAAEARDSLKSHFSEGEAAALVREIFFRIKGYTPADMVLKAGSEVSPYIVEKVQGIITKLLDDEPIQYIFGVSSFYGMDFKVSPDVLIPRPETAELVDLIVKERGSERDLRVLDICTGSGAIAIALSRNLPFSKVEAFDISPQAIEIARENATSLRARTKFYVADALAIPTPHSPCFDIIVCNPPYITRSERSSVDPNVFKYEPHLALFVPDETPLLFYRAVSRYALGALFPSGSLCFEINPNFADRLKNLLLTDGWEDVSILPDSSALSRFAFARKPS